MTSQEEVSEAFEACDILYINYTSVFNFQVVYFTMLFCFLMDNLHSS